MTRKATGRIAALLVFALGGGCGVPEVRVVEPGVANTGPLPDAGPVSDAGALPRQETGAAPVASSDAAVSAPPERPFAATPGEAKGLIQAQIGAHMAAVWKCLEDYRAKKGNANRGVTLDLGIDQEGTLVGVVAAGSKKGGKDPVLKACVTDALHDAVFPRSHSGITTIRQTFTDAPISP